MRKVLDGRTVYPWPNSPLKFGLPPAPTGCSSSGARDPLQLEEVAAELWRFPDLRALGRRTRRWPGSGLSFPSHSEPLQRNSSGPASPISQVSPYRGGRPADRPALPPATRPQSIWGQSRRSCCCLSMSLRSRPSEKIPGRCRAPSECRPFRSPVMISRTPAHGRSRWRPSPCTEVRRSYCCGRTSQ